MMIMMTIIMITMISLGDILQLEAQKAYNNQVILHLLTTASLKHIIIRLFYIS